MSDPIVRFLGRVLALFAPRPRGRHRLEGIARALIPPPPPRFTERLDGHASPVVRPYVLTPGERRAQRERRRALYLATLGIDTGPRHIHGVPVPVAAR
ncbi:hypothetical protein AB0E78_25960 [Streptomyces sp. NPDC032198]|uniref:hypothetical protein n=1 Tax=Streptomyces sp. NPDC032198 TaxID=3155127 RepID=UPI0033EC76CE